MGIGSNVKSGLLRIYNYPLLDKSKTNDNQKLIRNIEWNAVSPYILKGSKFLDVGCGAGYAMFMAASELNCEVYGIDPEPGAHGVGRTGSQYNIDVKNIKQGFAESIDFGTNEFDVVYSSHVLEHVNSESESLKEMNRVLKDSGVLIIGVPTSAMAWISLFTQWIFTTHHRFVNFFMSPFITTGKVKFKELFIPVSHSFSTHSVFYDIKHYKTSNWKKTISDQFEIETILLPAIYPFPEYRQWFRLKRNRRISSSVFFICKKKVC